MIAHEKIDNGELTRLDAGIVVEQLLTKYNQQRDLQLFLSYFWECSPGIDTWTDMLCNIVDAIKTQHPDWKIYLLANSWFGKHHVQNKLGLIFDDILLVDYFAYRTWDEIIVKKTNPVAYRWPQDQNKFLFLTGQPLKYNRTRLLYKFFKEHMLLQQSEWSFHMIPNADELVDLKFQQLLPDLTETQINNFIQTCLRNPDQIELLDVSTRDGNMFGGVGVGYTGIPYDVNLYTSTLFSVVSETSFIDTMHPWITEKTWKTIINKHPFIMAGDTHTLHDLRRRGFATFENFLPVADYDTIVDNEQRLDAVVENTKFWLKNLKSHSNEIDKRIRYNFFSLEKIYQQNVQHIDDFIKRNNLNLTRSELVITKHDPEEYVINLRQADSKNFQLHQDRGFCEFYNSVKDSNWPVCTQEKDFELLPPQIQHELCSVFGYVPLSKE